MLPLYGFSLFKPDEFVITSYYYIPTGQDLDSSNLNN